MPAFSIDTYSALYESAPDAMLVVDAAGRIVLVNAQAEQLFGVPRAELEGRFVESLLPERLHEAHVRLREAYTRSPRVRRMGSGQTFFARRGDGTEFPVEIALGAIAADGQVLYAACVRDVTDLDRTRRAAARGRYNAYVAQFGLQALEHPDFETLIHAAAPLVAEAMQVDAVVVLRLTPDRREVRCIASHGIATEAAARMRAPNDPSFLPGYLIACREPVHVNDTHTETRFRIMDVVRELGLRSALCVPLFDRGEAIGGLTVRGFAPRAWSEDDTHFLQAVANILATAAQRAATEETLLHSQRLEALGQLTGGVAHDFNNLLMVISGSLQMLEDRIGANADDAALAQQAIGAVDRAAMLTRKLLAFARKQPLHPRVIDLNQLITEFRDLLQRTLGEQISVRLRLDPALPPVVVDATQLETALLNLALNARDAMPQGGLLRLETRRQRIAADAGTQTPELQPGNYALVDVADSGTGMSAVVLARAIEPFFTTKETGKGSGLGLSMVYGFARQSGGTLQLRSTLSQGTTATLCLPIPPQAHSAEAAAGVLALPVGSETVLVVEDDAAVRTVAVAFLERLGYRVHQTRDGEGALRILRENAAIELLFTDVSLPGIDGIELATVARALRPSLAVLFTSGFASGGTLERLSGYDRERLLAKPYRREELAFSIRKALADPSG